MVDRRGTRDVAARLVLAVGSPVLCIGFPFVDAFVRDHILTGGWAFVWYAVLILFLLPAVLLAASYIYEEGYIRYKLFGLAAAAGFAACLVLTLYAEGERTLAERGRTAHCLVETMRIDHHYEVGAFPLTYPVSDYVYHLRCPQGGPDRMVTGSPIANKGASVTVLWDPLQRVPPQPVRRLDNYMILFWLATGSASVGVLFILLDALIDPRDNGRTQLGEDAADETLSSLLDSAIEFLMRR